MRFKTLLALFAALSAPALAQPARARSSAPTPFAPMSPFSPTICSKAARPGSRGYDIAARYVATQFQALGLSPAMADGSWLQPIEFLRYRSTGTPSLSIGGRASRRAPTSPSGRCPKRRGSRRRRCSRATASTCRRTASTIMRGSTCAARSSSCWQAIRAARRATSAPISTRPKGGWRPCAARSA